MTNPTTHALATIFRNNFLNQARIARVVNNIRAGEFLQEILGHHGRHDVPGNGSAQLIDQKRPVAVAVESHTKVQVVFLDLGNQKAVIGVDQRIGNVVRECPVELKKQRLNCDRPFAFQVRNHRSAHAVAGIHGDVIGL